MGFGGQRLSDSLMGFSSPPPPPRSEGVAGLQGLRPVTGGSECFQLLSHSCFISPSNVDASLKGRCTQDGHSRPSFVSLQTLDGMGDESPVQF